MFRPAFGALVLFAASGCASTFAVSDAEHGRYLGLSARVGVEIDRGRFDARDAEDLARAVARSEVKRAKGDEGVAHVEALGACARHVEGALEDRAEGDDAVAAEATMVLLDHGLEDPIDYTALAKNEAPWWRAVGARGMIGLRDGEKRRALLVDADENVRLAAIAATAIAADPADAFAVLASARQDPNALARTRAIHALGAIGGENVVLALKDLWPRADAPIKMAIADAWASPRSARAGGLRELAWAAESQRGEPAIAAAFRLVALDPAERENAAGVLARSIADGPREERLFAIEVAPLDVESTRAAIVKAEDDKDEAVVIAAAGRRLERSSSEGGAPEKSKERGALEAKLLEIARSKGKLAFDAKRTLARAGVEAVGPLLVKYISEKDPWIRRSAADALAVLGDVKHAAIFAVDEDAGVRIASACAILNASRR